MSKLQVKITERQRLGVDVKVKLAQSTQATIMNNVNDKYK